MRCVMLMAVAIDAPAAEVDDLVHSVEAEDVAAEFRSEEAPEKLLGASVLVLRPDDELGDRQALQDLLQHFDEGELGIRADSL